MRALGRVAARERHPAASTHARGVKLLVTGPFDAGKTTLIETVSETAVVATEQRVSAWARDAVSGHSGRTTVAMDYGRVAVHGDLVVHLYGTPGQNRFRFMWDILAEGMLGLILVVDARRPETFADARDQRAHFMAAANVPMVVAVNKLTPADDVATVLATVRGHLDVPRDVPVMAADARDRDDASRVLTAVLRAGIGQAAADAPARGPLRSVQP